MRPASERASLAAPLPLPAPWSFFPPLASAVSIFVGGIVLLGWVLDVEILKRARPGFVAMNPLTAVLFISSGIALGLSLQRNPSTSSRWIARTASMGILALACVKLIGLGLHWNWNVDQWLFPAKLNGLPGDLPNRMAPNTAANFLFVAAALLTFDLPPRRFSWSQAFALLAGLGALLPLTGYLYGVTSFEGMAAFIPMAVHTAITFMLLSIGLFFAREVTPLTQLFATDDSRGVVARRLFPAVIGVTLFLGWLRITGERRGLFEPAFGTALYAVTLCVLFVLLIRWTIWTVGKVEEQRDSLNDALVMSKWQLEETLRQTQLVVDHARELICALDAEGKFLSLNAACEEVLMCLPQRLLGASFVELHSTDDQRAIESAFAAAKSGLTPETFGAQCRKADASHVRLSWSIQWSPHYGQMFCVGRAA